MKSVTYQTRSLIDKELQFSLTCWSNKIEAEVQQST